jgi:hypothetical protein
MPTGKKRKRGLADSKKFFTGVISGLRFIRKGVDPNLGKYRQECSFDKVIKK